MYQLQELPYNYQDFEPYIDTHTLGLHYNKHQKTYLNNLNKLLQKNNYNYKYTIEKLIFHVNEFNKNNQEDILFNLAGVINHDLYWKSIKPKNQQKPTGDLQKQIKKQYTSYENLLNLLKESALKVKGSGYTFLVIGNNSTLDIVNTKNQENPLLSGYFPILAIDLWEHAYYINYENERARYIDNLEPLLDFTYANSIYNSK